MSGNYNELARQRVSIEALMRQGRSIRSRDTITMESAESYSALVDVVIDDTMRPVVDGTQTPDEVLEEAYNRLAERHQVVEQAIESQSDVDNLLGDTVSLSDDGVADTVVELGETIESLEALRNTARVIFHTPSLRKRATLESFQRHAAHRLREMDIPKKSYKPLLKKNASLESIHSVLNRLTVGATKLMDRVSASAQSVSAESLVQLGDPEKALKIQRAQKVLGDHAEKRGGKNR